MTRWARLAVLIAIVAAVVLWLTACDGVYVRPVFVCRALGMATACPKSSLNGRMNACPSFSGDTWTPDVSMTMA